MSPNKSAIRTLLAIETAGSICSAAFWREGAVVAEEVIADAHGHAIELVPMIQRIALKVEQDLRQLDAVAATVGPGSFTGIRVGLATARGIALAAGCASIGIDSFQRLAWAAQMQGISLQTRNLVVLDSRRTELFVATLGPDLDFIELPRIATIAEIAHDEADIVLTDLAADRLVEIRKEIVSLQPAAAAVASLAMADQGRYRLPAEPRYLRAPDISSPRTESRR